jgi:phosphoenolpyruvate carboxylase
MLYYVIIKHGRSYILQERSIMVKEFFGTGDSAIRPDKKMTDRQVVIVLTEHPTEKTQRRTARALVEVIRTELGI